MKRGNDDRRVVSMRRILVAVDASPSSLAAIEAAARLAAELEAELEGLFVEDVNQLHFAALPFTRVIDSVSATTRPVAPADITRAMKTRAERARRALAAAAGTRVSWRFRVVRGSVESEVLEAARKADLVSLGFTGDRPSGGVRAGSLARRAVLELPGSVLLLRQPQRAGAPVAVCYEDGPGGERALSCAATFARAQGGGLVVVTAAGSNAEERRIEARVVAHLGSESPRPRFRHVGDAGTRLLLAALNVAHGGVLVANADSPLFKGEALRGLVDRCACSLFLAR